MNPVQLLISLRGRINREAFWLAIVPLLLAGMLGWLLSGVPDYWPSILGRVLGLSVVWPLYAVNVKRLHDRDKSGWWTLIGAIPIVGQVWNVIECGLLPGASGYNAYGEPPPRLLLLNQASSRKPDSSKRPRAATEAADAAAERVTPDFASLMKMAGLMARSDADEQAKKFDVVRGYLSSDAGLDAKAIEDAVAIAWGSRFSRDSFEANAEVVKAAHVREGGRREERGERTEEEGARSEDGGERSEEEGWTMWEAGVRSEDGGESDVGVDTAGLNAIADFLFELAMVDETLSANEEILLAQLHSVFGFWGSSFSSHRQLHGSWRSEAAAHVPLAQRRRYYGDILGLDENITPEKVKLAFRRLVKQYHPDKVMHLGPKLKDAADLEMKKINEAYSYFSQEFDL